MLLQRMGMTYARQYESVEYSICSRTVLNNGRCNLLNNEVQLNSIYWNNSEDCHTN